MRKTRSTPIVPVLMTLLASCAAPSFGGDGVTPRGDPDVITREEMDENSAGTAYALVQTLRPQWLQTRGFTNVRQAAGAGGIAVYMDNARLGDGVNEMRRVALAAVQYLQFFDAREATLRWGGGHVNGAILISTRNR